MAKKAKKEKGLWAVLPFGSDYVYIYSTKPKAKKEACDMCGQRTNDYSGTYLTELCKDVAKHIPGLVAGGGPVKFKVVAA